MNVTTTFQGRFKMNNVYVAGSINMDVVATAARYPKMGETVPGGKVPIKRSRPPNSALPRY